MATVSEIVEDVADAMIERRETVNAYARALIDAGLLPKSRGRAIAQVEPLHIIRLFLAVALQPKIKDAASVVEKYGNLTVGGIPRDFPDTVERMTVERALVDVWDVLMRGDVASRKDVREAEIEVIETWPEVNIHFSATEDQEAGIMRLTDEGNPGRFWRGYMKRSAIIHARAFIFLGFGKGRCYRTATDE